MGCGDALSMDRVSGKEVQEEHDALRRMQTDTISSSLNIVRTVSKPPSLDLPSGIGAQYSCSIGEF